MPEQPPIVVLAVDTTGPDIERDRITTIAASRIADGAADELVLSVESPLGQVAGDGAWPRIAAVPLTDASAQLERFAAGAVVVGVELESWMPFLRRHGALADARTVDLGELLRVLRPVARVSGFVDVLRQLDLAGEIGSDSEPDARRRARLTAQALDALVEMARALEPGVAAAIARIGRRTGWAAAMLLAPSGVAPTTGDAVGGGRAPRRGAPSLAPPPEPLRETDAAVALDAPALEALLSPGGKLSTALPEYRDRPGQRRMLRTVCDAFDLGDQLLVEAGTGTGKTLAYLIPAAAWSLASGRHVVIATNTIALQDQLMTKDVPAVRGLVSDELRVAVLKGRANYLCRTRLAALAARDDLTADAAPTVARLLVWSTETRTGDRSELELDASETHIWRSVSAEGDACTPETCAHAAAGTCWLHWARAQAESAHIIVVNHALLISDMMVDNRLLPRHEHLVIDEAHHLEEVATKALGFTGSRSGVRSALAALDRPDDRGLLPELLASLGRAQMLEPSVDWRPMIEGTTGLRRAAHAAGRAGDALFDAVEALVDESGGKNAFELRLTEGVRHSGAWQRVEEAAQDLTRAFSDLTSGLVRLGNALVAAEGSLDRGPAHASDVSAAVRELRHYSLGLRECIADPSPNDVVWVERRGRQVAVHSVPLHVGEALAERLFADKEVLVLTSATLRAGPGFGYLRDRLDLPDAPGEVVESPFDFDEAVLVAAPADLPPPGAPGYQGALDECVSQLALALGGRLLVLYTSHGGLRQTYHAIRGPLGAAGIAVIAQGMDGSRRRLLERFAAPDRPTVLLGTRSFWEGVDVPGDALTGLLMARLPFDVPTDPVFAARSETFEDPFTEFALPRAVLRFRQGFGRLIRRETDRGVFAILDSRVCQRSYGQLFLEGLPGGRVWTGPRRELAAAAADHIADG